jgi:hypothetical protein
MLSSIPIFRSRKGAVSSTTLLVEALASHHELTIAELHAQLFGLFKYKISYQGVRKVVLNLKSEGVLKERAGKYRINRDWLLKARASLDRLLTATVRAGSQHVVSVDTMEVYHADSLFSADTLWGDLLREICEGTSASERSILSINHQAFWLLLNVGRETELISDLSTQGWRVQFLFSVRSTLNRWAVKFYREMGIEAHIGKLNSIPESTYYNVIGDTVIEVTLDPGLVSLIRTLTTFSGSTVPTQKLHRLSRTKGRVTLKVQRNALFANALKASTSPL